MGKIAINKPETTIMLCESLIAENKKFQSVYVSINYLLGELTEYWAENNDQQTFYKGMEESAVALKEITECNELFGKAIINYIVYAEDISSKQIGQP